MDESSVAEFLLSRRYYLAALELHQELLEGNNGMHNVSALNRFFTDAEKYAGIARGNEAKIKQSAASPGLGSAMAAIQSPFIADGLHATVAARDQTIALLQFQLRAAEDANRKLQAALAVAAGEDAKLAQANGAAAVAKPPAGSFVSRWIGSDEEGTPISQHERATLNALVRRYLLARGFKATAVALAEEVHDQDLGPDADDAHLLALPGAKKAQAGSAPPTLSLLAMHRQRIAPIQALAESEARSDSEISALRAELRAAQEQLDLVNGELEAAKARAMNLEQENAHLKTVRGSSAPNGAAGAVGTPVPTAPGPAAASAPSPSFAPGGTPPARAATGAAGTITMSNAPALLRVVAEGMPMIGKHIVTKHRSLLVPILCAAIATEASADARRGMLKSLLMLIHRPTHAERQLIRTQLGVLASRLGQAATEVEIMPEIMRLAEAGKTKERKALAAALCGALSPYVSDKRVDALLATLTSLADNGHALVRVGVVDGITAVAQTMSERWKRALASGTVVGSNTSMEQFIVRQFNTITELMWRALLSNTDENDAAELAEAAQAEFPLALAPHLALFGTPAHAKWAADTAAAAQAARAAGKPGSGPPPAVVPPLSLPQSWSTLPVSVSAAVAGSMVPVMTVWAYRLGLLWTRFVPDILSLLDETLHRAAPLDGLAGGAATSAAGGHRSSIAPLAGKAAASVRLGEWHQRRVALVLETLRASTTNLRIAAFDEGYSITFNASPEGAAQGASEAGEGGAAGQGPSVSPDLVFDMFDFTSQAAVQAFPPEKPIEQRPGAPPPPAAIAPQARQIAVLNALARGTAAVRARRNIPANVPLPANIPPYHFKPIRDEQVAVQWPAMKFIVRTLVTSLVRQAACVNRSSVAGRAIVDSYADALNAIATAFGPGFTAYVVRPMFLRALGFPLDIPPAPPAPTSGGSAPAPGAAASAGAPAGAPAQGAASTAGPGGAAYTGRQPSLVLLAQVLLGVPARLSDARAAAAVAANANAKALATTSTAASNINFGSAGPKGSDWPIVLPELAWMHHDSPDNPAAWGSRGTAGMPPVDPSGVDYGGVWNAAAVMPLYGTGVLASSELMKASKELLLASLKHFIVLIAARKHGWEAGQHQVLIEDCVRRAGGGNSVTGSANATAAHSHSASSQRLVVPASPTAAAATHQRAGSQTASQSGSPALTYILNDVLSVAAQAKDPAVRAIVAGLYRSVIPLLSPGQLHDAFMPVMKRMSRDPDGKVTTAAVRAMADVYSTGACNDDSVRDEVNEEIHRLLGAGPKDVILEIVRAMMRAIPNAAPTLRDEFILNELLVLNERLVDAAAAGAKAMRDFCATVGDIEPGDVHSAAAQAARAQRSAAIQAAEVWRGARAEDLEEVSMAICEAFRAFGPCSLSPSTKDLVRRAATALLDTDLLNPSYRDMIRGAIDSFFPVEYHGGYDGVEDDGYAAQAGTGVEEHAAEPERAVPQHAAGSAAHADSGTIGTGFTAAIPVHHEAHDNLMTSLASAFKGTTRMFQFGLNTGGAAGGGAASGHGPSGLQRMDSSHHAAPAGHPPAHPPAAAPKPPAPGSEAPVISFASFAAQPAQPPAPAPAPSAPLAPSTDLRGLAPGAPARSAAAAAAPLAPGRPAAPGVSAAAPSKPAPAPTSGPSPGPGDAAPTFSFSSFAANPPAPAAPAPAAAPAAGSDGDHAAGRALNMGGMLRSMRAAVGARKPPA